MKLYMIRHGESESNADGTHSGWSPVNLTEKGIEQVSKAARLLMNTRFERVFVSDVKRAQQTAKIIFPGREFVYLTLLREINNTAMRGKTKEQMTEMFGEIYLRCREQFDYAPLGMGCESRAHLSQRAAQALDFFARQPYESIAAVCHAGTIKAAAANVLNVPMGELDVFCDNASINIFEFKNGKWKLKAWNIGTEL